MGKCVVMKTVAELQQGAMERRNGMSIDSAKQLLPARQHGKQNRIAPPEVVIERGGGVEACKPDQRSRFADSMCIEWHARPLPGAERQLRGC